MVIVEWQSVEVVVVDCEFAFLRQGFELEYFDIRYSKFLVCVSLMRMSLLI